MRAVVALLIGLVASSAGYSASKVVDSPHNLSLTGPGQVKSQTEDQVCAFCHTPHVPRLAPGLWNRQFNPAAGKNPVTQSGVNEADADYVTSLCQSCHDGTIALGEMLNPPRGRSNIDLRNTRLTGRSKFGVSLSNHHPVGMTYFPSANAENENFLVPTSIDLPMKNNKLQCTTCHDPHSSSNPPFLNKSNINGELCLSCHYPEGENWEWLDSAHATSNATARGSNPWSQSKSTWRGQTVAENACQNCHVTHNAKTPQKLVLDIEERTCFRCHNGHVAKFSIQSEFQKYYRHPIDKPKFINQSSQKSQSTISAPVNSECEDCHNPHASRADSPMISFNPAIPGSSQLVNAPYANGVISGVSGIDISGQFKEEIEYEYEVCLKCHGVFGKSACGNQRCSTAMSYQMTRQDEEYNLREKIDSGNPALVSYHPIDTNNPANNSEVPSLRIDMPLNKESSRIYCGDCHASENSPAAGGQGPSGPHGSRHEGLLALRYELKASAHFNVNSSPLCFKCHSASDLFNDTSFKHRLHVLDEGKSCVNCHDPHGSVVYPHLINFLTSSNSTGQLLRITGFGMFDEPTWEDRGQYSGTCYLSCHGVVHDGAEY